MQFLIVFIMVKIMNNNYITVGALTRYIKYKLDKSYEVYLADVLKSVWNLNGQDPMKILKRVDSGGKGI